MERESHANSFQQRGTRTKQNVTQKNANKALLSSMYIGFGVAGYAGIIEMRYE